MSHYKTIQALGTPVVLHSNLTKFLGSITASAFLSHIMYWSDKTDNALGVYKSCEQITDETGLSKKEQMTARKILRELGLIVETHKRLEHRLYYRFEPQAFDAWFEANLAKCQKASSPSAKNERPEVPKGNFGENPNGTSLYTKITTENTTKITTESDYAPTHADEKNSQGTSDNKQTGKTSSDKKPTITYAPPSDLTPTPTQIQKCKAHGIDAHSEFENFTSWAIANGKGYANWSMGFNTWIKKSIAWGKPQPTKPTWQQTPKPNRKSELQALASVYGDDFYSRNSQTPTQNYQDPQIGENHE